MSDPTPALTDEQRVTEVLTAHHWGDDTAQVGHHAMQCGCGWTAYETGSIYTLRARHDQHRAEALARMVAEAKAEAWDEGYEAGDQDARAVNPDWPGRTANPYRTDNG